MRTTLWAGLAGILLAAPGPGQDVFVRPPVQIGSPVPVGPDPAPALPAPKAVDTPPPPADGFGSDLPGVIVSPPGSAVPPAASHLPGVRPPMPVMGPPTEVPPGPHVWVEAEYLLWRSKGGLLPPLITDVFGSTPNPLLAYPLSDSRINGSLQRGVRLSAGAWLDKPYGTGLEARYTGFVPTEDSYVYSGPPALFLSRPFWDVANGRPALFQLSNANGALTGAAEVRTSFDSWGLEANMLRRGPTMFSHQFHWVLGVKYWTLGEDLLIGAGSETGGLRAGSFDQFTTRNHFYGGQVGGLFNWIRSGFIIDLRWVLSLGAMTEDVRIRGGSTAVLPTGAQMDRPFGFLALASNSGHHSRTKFAMIRDVSLGVTYCMTDHVKLRLGYDGSIVSYVVRPGEQMDLLINPSLLPFSGARPTAPLLPGFRFNQETYWMHGFTFGMTVQF